MAAGRDVRWAEAAVGRGARVVRSRSLARGSTDQTALDVVSAAGSLHRLMLRRFHDAERLRDDPWYRPADEVGALEIAATTGIPVPRVVAFDQMRADPIVLLTRLPGRRPGGVATSRAFMAQAAAAMVAVHAAARAPAKPYARYYNEHDASWIMRRPVWQRAQAVVETQRPPTANVFIHRDFHQHNTLWTTTLSGVVDWTTGCAGPAGIDVARMRVNLAIRFGLRAAEAFGRAYLDAGGDASARHPYWDVLDAVDLAHDLPPPRAASSKDALARLERLVARACSALSAG